MTRWAILKAVPSPSTKPSQDESHFGLGLQNVNIWIARKGCCPLVQRFVLETYHIRPCFQEDLTHCGHVRAVGSLVIRAFPG